MRWVPTFFAMLVVSVVFTGSAIAADTSANDSNDSNFHDVRGAKGDFKNHNALKTEFSPKTASWRCKITSSKVNQKAGSSVQVTFWVEVKVGPNKVYHAVPDASFRGTGGDGKVITFNNGVDANGDPRKFKIELMGSNAKLELTFQDQSPDSKDKSDGKKGKKK